MRVVGRSQQFSQPIQRNRKIPPPESHPWWFHPSRAGTPSGPPSFVAELAAFDPDLAVTFNPYHRYYQLWLKKPSLQTKICWGWMLLFNVPESVGLDDRVFARLYSASMRKWGNGKRYFDAIQREVEESAAREKRDALQDTIDQAMESFDHSQIKVSGFGKSNGSKFANYHQ